MKIYHTLLFDWDGCLANTLSVWLKAYHQTFAQFDLKLTDQEITTQVFGDWRGAEKFGVQDIQAFNKSLMTTVNQEIKQVDLYPGAKDLLLKLKQLNKPLALLTSSTKEFIKPALEKHSLTQVFDLILDSSDVSHHKPDPEIIHRAIKDLKAEKASSIMIGDSQSDLGAAQSAGIDSLLFYPDSHQIFYDKKTLLDLNPTHVISHFRQASSILI